MGQAPLHLLLSTLCSAPASCDRISAAHRIERAFAQSRTREEARELASSVCTPEVCEALARILTEGEELSEIGLHLMLQLCVDEENTARLCSAGILPILNATLRVSGPHFQLPGLAWLSLVAEEQDLVPLLLQSGESSTCLTSWS